MSHNTRRDVVEILRVLRRDLDELRRRPPGFEPGRTDTVIESTTAGRLLVMAASGDSVASGGDYASFGIVLDQAGMSGSGESWTHPISGVYMLDFAIEWDSYTGGGTVELEVGGTVIATIGDGSSGASGRGTVAYRADALSVGKIKVTQSSGSAQTADASLVVAITGPRDATGWTLLFSADCWGIHFDGTNWWTTEGPSGATVSKRDSNGTQVASFEATHTTTARGIVHTGTNLWVTGSDQTIAEYNEAGTLQSSWEGIGTNVHDGITFDGTDLWLVYDDVGGVGDAELRRYNTSGTLQQTIQLPLENYGGIAYHGGRIYIANATDDTIEVWETSGSHVATIDVSDATATPTGVWVADDGTVYVSEDGVGVWRQDT